MNPNTVDTVLYVNAKGRVVTNQGASLPGVSVSVVSGGTTISEDVTDNQGVYNVRLRRNQDNAVRASRSAFNFEPQAILVTPRQSEVLREIVGSPRLFDIPGAGQQQVDDPVGVGARPAAIEGRVAVRLMMHPDAGALDSLMNNQGVLIRDAVTNRVIDTRTLDGFNDFTYIGPVGKEIVIEPVVRGSTRWYPSSRRLRISRAQQNVTFQWRVDQAPPARPILRPVARPSVTPDPTPRPVLRPVPIATPTPRPILRPF
ncbi:MAG: hypothetical protein WEB60_13645 [Terrimicrobiaceae bacterium]